MGFSWRVWGILPFLLFSSLVLAEPQSVNREQLIQRFRTQATKHLAQAQQRETNRVNLRDLQVDIGNFRWGALFTDAFFAETADIFQRWHPVNREGIAYLFWEAKEKIITSSSSQRVFYAYLYALAELSRSAGADFHAAFARFLFEGEEYFRQPICCGDWLGRYLDQVRTDAFQRVWKKALDNDGEAVVAALASGARRISEFSIDQSRDRILSRVDELRAQNDANSSRVLLQFINAWRQGLATLSKEQDTQIASVVELFRRYDVREDWLRHFLLNRLADSGPFTTRAIALSLAEIPNLENHEVETIFAAATRITSPALGAVIYDEALVAIFRNSPSTQEFLARYFFEQKRELMLTDENMGLSVIAAFGILENLGQSARDHLEMKHSNPAYPSWRNAAAFALGACATCPPRLEYHLALLMHTIHSREWLRQRSRAILADRYRHNIEFQEYLANPRENMDRLRDVILASFRAR